MDYFQGVVTEYLRAKRSRFVNTEYLISLDGDGTYRKDRHWYCDAVAIDFAEGSIHLCEITYAKTLHSVAKRLQFWCAHWQEIGDALRRDSELKGDWEIVPRVFIPASLKPTFELRAKAIKWPALAAAQMPRPIVTTLEEVLPWRYRSWNGEAYEEMPMDAKRMAPADGIEGLPGAASQAALSPVIQVSDSR